MMEGTPEQVEFFKIAAERMAEAERRLFQNLAEALYSGDTTGAPPTEEQLKQWAREARIRKLLKPWYWIRWRIVGTWNVWTKGECGECEQEDCY